MQMNFRDIVGRMMSVDNLRYGKQKQLAESLGMSATALNNRIKNNSIPEDKIKLWCSMESINMDWVLTGEGIMHTASEKPTISEAIGDGYSPEVKLAADYLEVKLKGKSAEEKLKFIEDLMEEIRRKNK